MSRKKKKKRNKGKVLTIESFAPKKEDSKVAPVTTMVSKSIDPYLYPYNGYGSYLGSTAVNKFDPPSTKWYFGYGSNMSRKRMAKRGVFWTQARRGILNGWTLCFDKKAGPEGVGYANIIKSKGHRVEGVLYKVEDEFDAKTLDMYEGNQSSQPYFRQPQLTRPNSPRHTEPTPRPQSRYKHKSAWPSRFHNRTEPSGASFRSQNLSCN